jgi:hypothetical protein
MTQNQRAIETGKAAVETTTFTLEGMSPTQKRSQYDQLILEGKQRNEEVYVEELKASGTPIYAAAQVAAKFGIPVDPTWVQKDLQRLMAVGDIFFPVSILRSKASEVHTLYVVPGRDGMRAILADVYSYYLKARASEHCDRIVAELRGTFLDKKQRANATTASVFIRSVFANYDDKQVHVRGKALEYCYFKNIAVDDFDEFVKQSGGLEGVRQLAMSELPKTPEQQAESDKRRAAKENEAETLAKYWNLKRKKALKLFPIPDALKSDFEDGDDLVIRAVVKNGELCVYWASNKPVRVIINALDAAMIDELGYEAKQICNGDVVAYMARQLDYVSNPAPAVEAFRELEAERQSEVNLGDEMPTHEELAEMR